MFWSALCLREGLLRGHPLPQNFAVHSGALVVGRRERGERDNEVAPNWIEAQLGFHHVPLFTPLHQLFVQHSLLTSTSSRCAALYILGGVAVGCGDEEGRF